MIILRIAIYMISMQEHDLCLEWFINNNDCQKEQEFIFIPDFCEKNCYNDMKLQSNGIYKNNIPTTKSKFLIDIQNCLYVKLKIVYYFILSFNKLKFLMQIKNIRWKGG